MAVGYDDHNKSDKEPRKTSAGAPRRADVAAPPARHNHSKYQDHRGQHCDAQQLGKRGDAAGLIGDHISGANHLRYIMDCRADEYAFLHIVVADRLAHVIDGHIVGLQHLFGLLHADRLHVFERCVTGRRSEPPCEGAGVEAGLFGHPFHRVWG